MSKVKSVYVCRNCGALYTEHVPADEGTDPCNNCGQKLKLILQSEDGIITLDQLNKALE